MSAVEYLQRLIAGNQVDGRHIKLAELMCLLELMREEKKDDQGN